MVTGWEAGAVLWQQMKKALCCLEVKQESARTGVGLAWGGPSLGLYRRYSRHAEGTLFRPVITCARLWRWCFIVGFLCNKVKCDIRREWGTCVLVWESLLLSVVHPCRLMLLSPVSFLGLSSPETLVILRSLLPAQPP